MTGPSRKDLQSEARQQRARAKAWQRYREKLAREALQRQQEAQEYANRPKSSSDK